MEEGEHDLSNSTENVKNELDATPQVDEVIEETEQNGASSNGDDLLVAFASAALDSSKESNETCSEKNEFIDPDKPQEPAKGTWYTVGFIKGTTCDVVNYHLLSDMDSSTVDDHPELSNYPTVNLEPGTAYKFRVAGINTVGKGEWSKVTGFKTLMPGFPEAPSAIKIAKGNDGAHLSWEPPSANPQKILEYSVYLAVGGNDTGNPMTEFSFIRVYCGPYNQCTVMNESLQAAHINTNSKPAIIFRIAAKNEKGYGPVTQVRWIQDDVAQNKTTRRSGITDQTGLIKKKQDGK
ncbi:unnamed protein product [Ceutorhynchus assimilis]|uniref:Fibronectin type-III domain-containing protein n=1 Tax=Ceutorhynchus assimilis TaxID=467358 RepID=A0A9P0DMR6_9CUCU|nr:unnamed protein product [Ceutorhynchus assimilis]